MNKARKLLSLFAVSLLLMTGCGSQNDSTEANKQPADSPKPTATVKNGIEVETDIQTPQRTDGVITLSLGFSTSLDDPRGVASQQFKKDVEANTNGTVKIALYPNSEKGNDNELITGVTTGELDMTVSSAGNFTGYVNEVGISALPFLFDDFEKA